jgi:hypothetical protein
MKALIEKSDTGAPPSQPRQDGGNQQRRQRRDRHEPEDYEIIEDEVEEVPTAMEIAMRRALGNDTISAVKTEQRGRKSKKNQREDKRRVQEELLKRTLTMQSDN